MENKKKTQTFLGMKELAYRWGCSRHTLSDWIKRISTQIPLYKPKQKLFSPAQYKIIAELLGFDI